MSLQIISLIFVVVIFSLLFGWVFWPGNRSRFDANSRVIFDQPAQPDKNNTGEQP